MQPRQDSNVNPSARTDTRVYKLARLASQLTRAALCCDSLERQLLETAEWFAVSQITCHVSTYNQLCSSVEMLLASLTIMLERLENMSETEDVQDLLRLQTAMREAVRLRLDHESVITMAEYMTSIENQRMTDSDDAGDTR